LTVMTKTQFQELASELMKFGENREELDFWVKIFDDMQPDNKQIVVALMQEELKQLEHAR